MFNELINNFSLGFGLLSTRVYILLFTRAWLSSWSRDHVISRSRKPLSAPKQSRGKPEGVPTIWSSAY